jgi:AraC-like DNA-binding protein
VGEVRAPAREDVAAVAHLAVGERLVVPGHVRHGWTGRAAMATMRLLLSEIDVLDGAALRPVAVSAGEVVYPPGGRLGPRWQRDVQLVLVHSGSARIAIDDGPPAFLHARLGDPGLALEAVARAAHVSGPHLVRRFRAELGVTPMAYLWQRRVATGIDLLTHTGLPVGEVAARAGFRSVYHFSRRVRAQTGLPPTAVRAARWGDS